MSTTTLPVGVVSTYHVGYPDLDQAGVGFLAVLVHGHGGEFKVYSAIVKLPPADTPVYEAAREKAAKRVARQGTPENYTRAVTFFPQLKREDYRA